MIVKLGKNSPLDKCSNSKVLKKIHPPNEIKDDKKITKDEIGNLKKVLLLKQCKIVNIFKNNTKKTIK